MRFEICETVPTRDQEMVLRALETCSREVSNNVVRYGDRITLQGLGPSPRARNVRDTTVFRVNAEDDKTIINGEVIFQASALLGDQPQGDVVRSKLEELFNQMKAQISLDAKRATHFDAALPDAVDAFVATHASENRSVVTLAPEREWETISEIPEPGLADAVAIAESVTAIGSEQRTEPDHTGLSNPNAGAEPGAELDRNVWLDDLFKQMKAQFELDEKLATHVEAAASIAAPQPDTRAATNSLAAPDISERADGETATDRYQKIMNPSSEAGEPAVAEAATVPESELASGLEKDTEAEGIASLEKSFGVEQGIEGRRSERDQDFDLKENAWLDELFNRMNAQIEREEKIEAEDGVAAASIGAVLPPATDAMDTVLAEDASLASIKEAIAAGALAAEPETLDAPLKSMPGDETPIVETELTAASQQTSESEHGAKFEPVAVVEQSVDLKRTPESEISSEPEQKVEPVQTASLEKNVEAVQAPTAKPSVDPGKDVWLSELKEVIESDLHIRRRVEEGVTGDVEETSPRKRLAMWVSAVAVLLLLAAGGYSLYRPRLNTAVPSAQAIEQPTAITTNPMPAAEPSPPVDAKPQALPPTQSQIVNPAVQVADVRNWLENWAAAMRTRDASAQAAFYADTVNQYVGKYDVSNDAVLKDREATIHMRKGLWTMKMEKVVITRQTKSEADVQLVKHFIDEPGPSEILESFVPTRLTLKRIDGSWKITSEQDLPASSPAPSTR